MGENEIRRLMTERDEFERELTRVRAQLTRMTEDRDRWVAAYRVADALADSEQRERVRAEAERDGWQRRALDAESIPRG